MKRQYQSARSARSADYIASPIFARRIDGIVAAIMGYRKTCGGLRDTGKRSRPSVKIIDLPPYLLGWRAESCVRGLRWRSSWPQFAYAVFTQSMR